MKNLFILLFAGSLLLNSCEEKPEIKAENEISNLIKEPSSFTIAHNDALLEYLKFADTTDFQNARKGFMGTIPSGEILQDDGSLSYSMKEFDFLTGNQPNTANPSLWRQSRLNSINGLFKVTENIYQIRGFDLANMTLIKGKTGWLIIDPLTVPATAKAAMALVKEKIGDFPVKAILLTHSHIDHFGGMRAFVSEEDLKSGKVKVLAPAGFFEHSISENVMGGNTMSRRAAYMYGSLLPKSVNGSLGSGLGTTTAKGETGILEPTDYITNENGETRIIDGVKIDLIFTPESEAPAEMMFYFPDLKAFCQAENISHTLHNLYTLRGAQVRNGQKWSQYIDRCIYMFGKDVEVSFGSHHWPTWGNETIINYWEKQRDLYRFIHDQTLRLANVGYTPIEIAEMLKLPETLDKEFYNRGYYGTVSHDAKAQYQLYFGWFDGNPSNLNPLPPSEAGAKYVEFMGGADNVISLAQKSFDKGEYRWVGEVLKHLVFADPKNQKARNLLADAYEQMGYQAESGPWRNFYLTGAKELRMGVKVIPMAGSSGPDMITGMSSELFFNYIAMRYKGTEENKNKYNFNFILTDRNEKASLIVSNGVVNPRIGSHLEKDVTATISMSRLDFAILTSGKGIKLDDLIKSGKIKIDGDADAFKAFLNNIDNFEYWFNIIEP
jgi:alkyl sulfatase BDS1-like metallo-beta-lactamase superfamily hydrolase